MHIRQPMQQLIQQLGVLRGHDRGLPIQFSEIVGLVALAGSILMLLSPHDPMPKTPIGLVVRIAVAAAIFCTAMQAIVHLSANRNNLVLWAAPIAFAVALTAGASSMARATEFAVEFAKAQPTIAAVVAVAFLAVAAYCRLLGDWGQVVNRAPLSISGSEFDKAGNPRADAGMDVDPQDAGEWPASCASMPHRYFVAYIATHSQGQFHGWIAFARPQTISAPGDVHRLAKEIGNEIAKSQPDLAAVRVFVKHWQRFEAPSSPPGAREDLPEPVSPQNVFAFQRRHVA